MQFYRIRFEAPYEFGGADILVHGDPYYEEGEDILSLERTGPFIPPLSGGTDLIATDEMRKKMEKCGLFDITYRHLGKVKIAKLHWEKWVSVFDPRSAISRG